MIREFSSFKHIFAIDPGLEATGWAVLSESTGRLLACGVARPFARVNQTQTIADIRLKILKIWEEQVGFSKQPRILAIEMPQIYQQKFLKGDPNDLIPLSVMGGLLWASLTPKTCYLPKPQSWKGQVPKNTMQERIFGAMDLASKKVLAEGLHIIPKYLRHNTYDAIGIGQWAFRKFQGEANDAK